MVEEIRLPAVPIAQAVDMYGKLTGRIAIRPAILQGQITLRSDGPLTRQDALLALESVLSINGYAVIPQGDKFFKVVPINMAKQEGVPISGEGSSLIPFDKLESRIFKLNAVDVKEVDPLLRPVIHAYGQITPLQRANALLITDTSANLMVIAKILDLLDQPLQAKVVTKFYTLKHAKAKDVVDRIKQLVESSLGGSQGSQASKMPLGIPGAVPSGMPQGMQQGGQMAPVTGSELTFSEEAIVVGKVTISADDRTNQIILLTRAINMQFFDQMIEKLDADTAAPTVIKTIPLKYAEAPDLAGLLNQILGNSTSGSIPTSSSKKERSSNANPYSSTQRTPPPVPSPQASPSLGGNGISKEEGQLTVHAEPRTNSLIVMGSEKDVKWVQDFVKDVDVLLAQVLLEGVVVEVTLNRTDNLGISVLARAADGNLTQVGLSKTLSISPIDAATIVSPASLPAGLATGLNYFASLRNPKLDILVQALAQNSNVRILSQPVIQTSHNKEAKIIVAEARPIVTATATDITGNLGTLRSSFEYKDIGLQLTVTPLINPDGLVVLELSQRVDNINGFQVIDNNQIPIISRREANSTVAVEDGSMVILGGLVNNTENVSKSGIPLLSDIPILGYLFSSTRKERVKTELMVLLKPTVLRTPAAASEEANRRRRALELFKKRTIEEQILGKPSITEKLDEIERPPSVPAGTVDVEKTPELFKVRPSVLRGPEAPLEEQVPQSKAWDLSKGNDSVAPAVSKVADAAAAAPKEAPKETAIQEAAVEPPGDKAVSTDEAQGKMAVPSSTPVESRMPEALLEERNYRSKALLELFKKRATVDRVLKER